MKMVSSTQEKISNLEKEFENIDKENGMMIEKM